MTCPRQIKVFSTFYRLIIFSSFVFFFFFTFGRLRINYFVEKGKLDRYILCTFGTLFFLSKCASYLFFKKK